MSILFRDAAAAVYLTVMIWYPVHAAQPFVHLMFVLPAVARTKKRETDQ